MKLPNGYGSVYKLSGNRRNPYIVRRTIGWIYDPKNDKQIRQYITIGYAPTKAKGLQMLAEYNNNPYDIESSKATFNDVYEKWSVSKYETISKSNEMGYIASYKLCTQLYDKNFKEIKLSDLQYIVDTCGKNYPTLRKLKVFFGQLYDYALKNEIVTKNYSEYVDILKYKDRNPNKYDRQKFTDEEIKMLWTKRDDKYFQIILMLIYSGVRVSELLDLKKENVHIDKQYFEVVASKTDSGIRTVPISDKVLPFWKQWHDSESKYLLHMDDGKTQFQYRNYYDSYFKPCMDLFSLKHKPHDTRHTCISMLAQADINPTTIKKIVGHSGAMSLTEKVYTHLDIQELVNAINKI